jgi:hypothetical protein
MITTCTNSMLNHSEEDVAAGAYHRTSQGLLLLLLVYHCSSCLLHFKQEFAGTKTSQACYSSIEVNSLSSYCEIQ